SAATLQRVEVDREGGYERLAFARLHLRDFPLMKDDTAHELDVVVAHLEGAPAGFAAHREGVGQQIVERRAVVQFLLDLRRLGLELGVAELLQRRLELVDLLNERLHALDGALVGGSEEFLCDPGQHIFACSEVPAERGLTVRDSTATAGESKREANA